MNTTFSVLLSLSFVVSLIALAAMVWAITQGRFFGGKQAAVSVLENAELDTDLDTQNASLVIFFLSVALIFLVVGVLCLSWVAVETAIHKKVDHIYVSAWYYLAALLWFPAL